MIFTITSYNFLLGMNPNYRLQKDSSWKEITDFHICNEKCDMIFNTHSEAKRWLKNNEIQLINGYSCSTSPYKEYSLGDDTDYSFEILVHRKIKPHLFTRDELKEVLRTGDDTVHNSLYVGFDGYLKLKNINTQGDFIGYSNYAVRNESYNAFNGYVGKEFEEDYINDLYLNLLEKWSIHLNTGRSLYLDYNESNLDENVILTKINGSLEKLH